MKKNILFVDDEAMVLEGIRRMLRGMREEWEMEFVESAEAALALLDKRKFDVVVSDMRMPQMNGAEFLSEVMKRHPTTVRLILSGYADKDLILKCVGSTHQYLAKPCDAESLKAAISRASNLENWLQSDRLKAVVCQMSRVPSLPTLYLEVVEKASRSDGSVEEIGRVVGKDMGMTAQVLKLTNSAFFGLRRQLSTAEEAVSYLGIDTIKSLVLSIHAFAQFEHAESGSLNIEALWDHSLRVARLAKRISTLEVPDVKTGDESFTAGILHDMGKLILAVNFPKDYAVATRLAQCGLDDSLAEDKVFGANHADVGGYLVGLWGLPAPVVEAVTLHHSPSRATPVAFGPLTCVHAANFLDWERSKFSQGTIGPQMDAKYLGSVSDLTRIPLWREAAAEP